MSYIDDELKIDVDDEEDDVGVGAEETVNDPLIDIPEEDDLLGDEFAGLSDSEY